MFNTMVSQMKSKAIINMDVHNLMWGYKNPIITLCNKLVPGLVYFDSLGFLDRVSIGWNKVINNSISIRLK